MSKPATRTSMEKQEIKLGCRVLLFPHPYVGHATPMFNLGNTLYSKGFFITIIQTRLNSSDQTAFPKFTFHYVEEANWSHEALASLDHWEAVTLLNKSFSTPFRDSLSQILEDASKGTEPVACLISDPLWDFAGTIADEFHLPRLALRTGGLLAFVLYEAVPLLRQKGYFPIQECEQEAAVLEFPPLKVKDLPPEANHDVIAAVVKEAKSYRHGFICNTFKELEGSFLDLFGRSLPGTPIFPIGPLHKYPSTCMGGKLNQDHSSITWLNTQAPNSVLYVSFGTLAAISKEQFLEVAWGLAESQQPFLWVVRPRMINGSDTDEDIFPKDFLEAVSGRGYTVTWASQLEVLAHPSVGGFWTHCGWNRAGHGPEQPAGHPGPSYFRHGRARAREKHGHARGTNRGLRVMHVEKKYFGTWAGPSPRIQARVPIMCRPKCRPACQNNCLSRAGLRAKIIVGPRAYHVPARGSSEIFFRCSKLLTAIFSSQLV